MKTVESALHAVKQSTVKYLSIISHKFEKLKCSYCDTTLCSSEKEKKYLEQKCTRVLKPVSPWNL